MNNPSQPTSAERLEVSGSESASGTMKAEAWRGVKLGVKWTTIVVPVVWILIGIVGVCVTYIEPSLGPKNMSEVPFYAASAIRMGIYFYCMAVPVGALAGAGLMSVSALWPNVETRSNPFE